MPIYAYRCEGCGFQKDALQKMSDPPLVDCPACSQPKLMKQVTAAGFALKGSGWYVTDFRDSGKKPASPSSDVAKTTGDSPAATPAASPASESKPSTATASSASSAASASSAPATPAPSTPTSA